MKTFKYNLGDTYPNIAGKLSYAGSVDIETASVELLADGADTGPFTGATVIDVRDSEDATMSYLTFLYDVVAADTLVEGSYDLAIRITHSNGDIESIATGDIAKVTDDLGTGP